MRSFTACFALLLLGLSGCASTDQPRPQQSSGAPAAQPTVVESSDDLSTGARPAGGGGAEMRTTALQEPANPQAVERKIIRNAEITLEADSPEEAQRRVGSIAESSGGFVVTSDSQQRGDAGVFITLTLRVPAAQFVPALDSIRAVGSRVLQEKVSAQDVTQEFIDLEARLRAKRALEAQFLEIMKQARSISDALEVQRQLAEVRSEIEQMEGRRRFLENQASLSTIVVKVQPPAAFAPAGTGSFFTDLRRALGDSVDIALSFVLGFVRVLGFLIPFAVLVVLPLYLLARLLIRRFATVMRKRQPPAVS
jgi:hypothetical protein